MRRNYFLVVMALALLAVSCTKETSVENGNGANAGNGGGTGGGGSNSNGDLLVKCVSVSGQGTTKDTNTVTLQWNAAKQLVQYKSTGKANGVAVDILYNIVRDANGYITKIFIDPLPSSGVDSIVHYPYYVTGSKRLKYVLSVTYGSILGDMKDSTVYVYNSNGQVTSREIFSENILSSVMTSSSKQAFTYDAAGNLTKVVSDIADFLTGAYGTQQTILTQQFDNHKASAVLGEESFIVAQMMGLSSPSNIVKTTTDYKTAGVTTQSSGGAFTQFQFNTFDRPTAFTITAFATNPIGTNTTTSYATYYYQ